MPLQPGDKLGPYEILAPIGKGGMGEVYRAHDPRMGRDVAIKISAERFNERFDREVRAVAALNHSNICHVYDVGPNYLVMELIEGPTLAERIKVGAISLEEALNIATQIAEALDAAHEKGIVHRDVKPGNIKIQSDAVVKVLDFGLATAVPRPSEAEAYSILSTESMALTEVGTVLGTAAYMAPEQAQGKPVDKRADIWAFGVVLYEMLTGKRLFQADTAANTLAAVLTKEPDLDEVPTQVRGVLKRCLQKDPKKRLRDISSVALLFEVETGLSQAEARTSKWPWVVAAAAILGLAAVGIVRFRETPPVLQAVQFALEPPPDTSFTNPLGSIAASPDGRYVVFGAGAEANGGNGASLPSLWLRPLDSTTARQLPGTQGGNFPTWSPDSRSLAFYADGKLKRIEISGGAPLTLGDAQNEAVTATGTWNRAGIILFGSSAGLRRVSAAGGGAVPLTKIDPGQKETGHGYPQFLPDDDRFLFFVDSGDTNVRGVYASSLSNPEQRQHILRTAAKAVYVPPRAPYPGYLLWMRDQTLLAQRFDAGGLKLEGEPVSVAEQVALNPFSPVRAAFWASDAGSLAYFANSSVAKRPLVWISRDGKELGDAAPEDNFESVALAPGEERMAVEAGTTQGNLDVWSWEFARNVMTRLTFDPATDGDPVWSPDGKQLAFVSEREGSVGQIYLKDISGAGQDERLTDGPTQKLPLDWSKDGRYLLYREFHSDRDRDLMALRLEEDRGPIPVVKTHFNENTGAISPDGRWVAFTANDSGRYELYVQAFPGVGGPAGRWQVSNGGVYDVKWRGDGKELYYQSLDGKVMAAVIQTSSQGVRAETPRALFSANFRIGARHHQFDVSSDGQRFLMILNSRSEENNDRLMVVSNWQAGLRR